MHSPEGTDQIHVFIRLKDRKQRDIFHRLCLDIVSAIDDAKSEKEAVEIFLARTWRWHRLLRGGRDGRLSGNEQKGLIGELLFMSGHLFPAIGVEAAVKSWKGPLNAPKDFEIGRVCVEVKAHDPSAAPLVTISSEQQLDTYGLNALFLRVAEISDTHEDDPDGITVADVVGLVHETVQTQGPSVLDILEDRLAAAGFDWRDKYGDKWLQGAEHLFEVADDFPCIVSGTYHAGITNVRYSISLVSCEPFRVGNERMISLLARNTNGD